MTQIAVTKLPAIPPSETIEQRFNRLAAEWVKAVAHHSSTTLRNNHLAYREIIALGPEVVPFLLRDLEATHRHWFCALREITGGPHSRIGSRQCAKNGSSLAELGQGDGLSMVNHLEAKKIILGLIGGIGSGKSAVANEFARHGGAIISGDQLGHEALRKPDIRDQVIARFGPGIVAADGEIDRRKVGSIVFADLSKLRALEKLVFPFIEQGLHQKLLEAEENPAVRLIVVDAAVMLETGWNKFCDKIVYIDAPLQQRLSRLATQRGWAPQEVEARSQAQLPLSDKLAQADAVIDNSGPSQALAPQIARLLEQWRIPVAFGSEIVDNS